VVVTVVVVTVVVVTVVLGNEASYTIASNTCLLSIE